METFVYVRQQSNHEILEDNGGLSGADLLQRYIYTHTYIYVYILFCVYMCVYICTYVFINDNRHIYHLEKSAKNRLPWEIFISNFILSKNRHPRRYGGREISSICTRVETRQSVIVYARDSNSLGIKHCARPDQAKPKPKRQDPLLAAVWYIILFIQNIHCSSVGGLYIPLLLLRGFAMWLASDNEMWTKRDMSLLGRSLQFSTSRHDSISPPLWALQYPWQNLHQPGSSYEGNRWQSLNQPTVNI